MPFYRKLRGAVVEKGLHLYDLAGLLGVEPMTVSQRMVGRTPWKLDEAYKTLDFIHKPHDMIFEYFPPEGRAPQ